MISDIKSKKYAMLNLILFGPPGSGKGTQAEKLVEKYNLLHISTGDLFRYEMSNDTPLGLEAKSYMAKGRLVPDSVTIGMLRNKVESAPDVQGYIFDGFPRTIPQAEALDALLAEKGQAIDSLVALDVPEDEIVARLLNRGKSSGRDDDNDEKIIRTRFKVYLKETAVVFDHYDQFGKSESINGIGDINHIFDNICTVIDEVVA